MHRGGTRESFPVRERFGAGRVCSGVTEEYVFGMFGFDGAARAQLFRDALTQADALHNLARYLSGNRVEAEDLVQETFARAAAGRLPPAVNLRAWLFRILRNAHLDQLRRSVHDPARPGADDSELEDVAAAGDPEASFIRKCAARDLEVAMRSLSEDRRTVILLDLEGLADGEIAEVIGCAPGTVKSRLSRARADLRRALGRPG